jgi:hypothetical protein
MHRGSSKPTVCFQKVAVPGDGDNDTERVSPTMYFKYILASEGSQTDEIYVKNLEDAMKKYQNEDIRVFHQSKMCYLCFHNTNNKKWSRGQIKERLSKLKAPILDEAIYVFKECGWAKVATKGSNWIIALNKHCNEQNEISQSGDAGSRDDYDHDVERAENEAETNDCVGADSTQLEPYTLLAASQHLFSQDNEGEGSERSSCKVRSFATSRPPRPTQSRTQPLRSV